MSRVNDPFNLFLIFTLGALLLGPAGCTPDYWQPLPVEGPPSTVDQSFSSILKPNPEDVPFFQAIADEQDKQLQRCRSDDNCRTTHFLRALAALYINQELAAHHFRRVIAAKPNGQLASESRFWLWVLEVTKSEGNPSVSSREFTKRLAREVVDRELIVHELITKLDHSSVEALQEDLRNREKQIEELNQGMVGFTKQLDQLKKETALRQALQKELKVSEKKVQELINQLEALRRIDQELKEKTPPTRPSEKMTPSPQLETEPTQENKKNNGG